MFVDRSPVASSEEEAGVSNESDDEAADRLRPVTAPLHEGADERKRAE